MRLDQYLVARGHAPSRHRAQLLIDDGAVSINGTLARKASQTVGDTDQVVVTNTIPYVSRAGLKLEHALREFGISVQGKSCLDIGSSTGGFTEVLLRGGAAHVDAVDVGTKQLHDTLRNDARVTVYESTDIRAFVPGVTYDGIVMDVSFISQSHIIPKITQVSHPETVVVSLIKPQFEVGRDGIGKGGIVISDDLAVQAAGRVVQEYIANGFVQVGDVINSPILGGDGNREYIAVFVKK